MYIFPKNIQLIQLQQTNCHSEPGAFWAPEGMGSEGSRPICLVGNSAWHIIYAKSSSEEMQI